MIEFSPSGVTMMIALPVGAFTVRRPARFTPASARESRRSRPVPSSPTQPMKATSPPIFPAATAWFAPLPPGVVTMSEPRTVSPAAGRRSMRSTRSALADPMTTTLWGRMSLLLSGRPQWATVTTAAAYGGVLLDTSRRSVLAASGEDELSPGGLDGSARVVADPVVGDDRGDRRHLDDLGPCGDAPLAGVGKEDHFVRRADHRALDPGDVLRDVDDVAVCVDAVRTQERAVGGHLEDVVLGHGARHARIPGVEVPSHQDDVHAGNPAELRRDVERRRDNGQPLALGDEAAEPVHRAPRVEDDRLVRS